MQLTKISWSYELLNTLVPRWRNLEKGNVGESVHVGEGDTRNVKRANHMNPVAHVRFFENTAAIWTHLTDWIWNPGLARVAKPWLSAGGEEGKSEGKEGKEEGKRERKAERKEGKTKGRKQDRKMKEGRKIEKDR